MRDHHRRKWQDERVGGEEGGKRIASSALFARLIIPPLRETRGDHGLRIR